MEVVEVVEVVVGTVVVDVVVDAVKTVVEVGEGIEVVDGLIVENGVRTILGGFGVEGVKDNRGRVEVGIIRRGRAEVKTYKEGKIK